MILDEAQLASLKKYTYAIYILQAFSLLTGITAILAIIIVYVKQDDVRGTWLQSHFIWQKTTFWYGLLWTVLGILTTPLLIGHLVLGAVIIWLMYRIARGWIYLVDGKELKL
tara:strand:- start:186 stop:521 length:336 start_codon:yes stop_codon:yes gene_type:complete